MQGSEVERTGLEVLMVPPFVESELTKHIYAFSVGLADRETVKVAETPNSFVFPLIGETMIEPG